MATEAPRSPVPRGGPAAQLLGVQRTAGNAAAARILARNPGAAGGVSSITPDFAKGLDDGKLASEMRALDARAGAVTDPGERAQLEQNLKILVDEQKRRAADAGKPRLVDTGLARPPGLPADTGFQLVQVDGAPSAVTDTMPEGQLMELIPGVGLRPVGAGGSGPPAPPAAPGGPVIPAVPAAPPSSSPGLQGAQVAGAGSFGAIAGGNAIVTSQGFAAAGEHALGIIAIPQIRNTLGPTANPVIDLARPTSQLGHTAMYLRQNGQIQWVRGFGPEFSVDFLKNVGSVGEGHAATPGAVANDLSMFKSTMAKTIEYPIDAALAEQVSGGHPLGKGGTGGAPENWTGKPNVFAHEHGGPAMMCANKNCVMYAVESVEGHLGGPVGPAGQGSVVNIPSSGVPEGVSPQGTASQGKLYGALSEAESGAAPFATPPRATGAPVVGSMPQALRYIKWGGRVFIVVGLAAGAWEVYSATPEQRDRTTTGVIAGTAGGFAGGAAGGALAGAAAGLVCGPGAPVCSLVFGIGGGLVGGVIGALGSRALAETAYDIANPRGVPVSGPLPAVVGKRPTECPSCHSELKKPEPGKSAFPPLGGSSTLASALIGSQGQEKPRTLTEAEIQMVAKYLNLPLDGGKGAAAGK